MIHYLRLFSTIEELGKNLSSIKLSIAANDYNYDDLMVGWLVRTNSLRMNLPNCNVEIKECEFKDIFTEEEIEEILPNCDVEIKECEFEERDDSDEGWNPYQIITMILMIMIMDLIMILTMNILGFDDGEQDSNSERNLAM